MQHIRNNAVIFLLAIALVFVSASAGQADPEQISREHHAWARFKPGAWKKVRIVTEKLDTQGRVTGTTTTDTTTVLTDIFPGGYRVQIEVSVEVAGKKFDTEPQEVARGLYGESEGQTLVLKGTSKTSIEIEGKKIPCQIYEYEIAGENNKRIIKVYYTDKVAPHLLKKESICTDSTGKETLYEALEEVIAVGMPHKVKSEVLTTSHVNTIRKNAKGRTVTVAVHAAQVPGGVIAYTSKELDAEGRLVRRSTLELLDYGFDPDRAKLRRRFFRRKKKFRD